MFAQVKVQKCTRKTGKRAAKGCWELRNFRLSANTLIEGIGNSFWTIHYSGTAEVVYD